MTEDKSPSPVSNLMGSQQQIEAAREFVKRHPALTLIDLAEFEAFLKVPAMIEAALPMPEDKKIAGVIRQLHALHHAFSMKGTNSVTLLRAVNTLSTLENKAKKPPKAQVVGEIWYRWRGPRGGWIFDNKKPAWPCDTVEVRAALSATATEGE